MNVRVALESLNVFIIQIGEVEALLPVVAMLLQFNPDEVKF